VSTRGPISSVLVVSSQLMDTYLQLLHTSDLSLIPCIFFQRITAITVMQYPNFVHTLLSNANKELKTPFYNSETLVVVSDIYEFRNLCPTLVRDAIIILL
jgi:hypothetical protein